MQEREVLNPLDYADNPAELEVQRELRRLNIPHEEAPDKCPECGSPLNPSRGYVGELVLVCSSRECSYMWEDAEDAIRRVL